MVRRRTADQGDLAKTEAQWRLVTAEAPDYLDGWRGLGEALMRQEKYGELSRRGDELAERPSLRGLALAWKAQPSRAGGQLAEAGRLLQAAVKRVLAVETAASEPRRVPDNGAMGGVGWHYSLDFNERCADVGYVLEFLARVGERSPAALGRVQYIEQPTHRDLKAHPHHRMHAAAAIKPVVIDESLIDLESLLTARDVRHQPHVGLGGSLRAAKVLGQQNVCFNRGGVDMLFSLR